MSECEQVLSNLPRLSNDDFRQLLMTPRPVSFKTPVSVPNSVQKTEKLKKKKTHLSKPIKEDDKLAELAARYRDRAQERRTGQVPTLSENTTPESANNNYLADVTGTSINAKEQRKKMIEKSKYLGGDMEHTHLVKGLDYALLRKVREDIEINEEQAEEELMMILKKTTQNKKELKETKLQSTFKTKLARNIHNIIAFNQSKEIKRNDLFLPGRMSYIVDLEDDSNEIPTTVIRSKADIPIVDASSNMTVNDIVINKLTEIVAYLRRDMRPLRNEKNKKNQSQIAHNKVSQTSNICKDSQKSVKDESIYGDIGEYVPSHSKNDCDKKSKPPTSYFDKPLAELNDDSNAPQLPAVLKESFATVAASSKNRKTLQDKMPTESGSYAECYPGFVEMQDAMSESDDEEPCAKEETAPRSVNTHNGEKTTGSKRKRQGKQMKDQKAKLDQEWQKIQHIMKKRKTEDAK